MILEPLFRFLPSVRKPAEKQTLKKKLTWTGIMLLLYFAMSHVTVYGVSETALQRFAFLELILGSRFGSLMTLGIGPIVTASIILQLMVGSKIINWDLSKRDQKLRFESTQKLLAIVITVVEAVAYVSFGAVPPREGASAMLVFLLIFQLSLGGWLVILMDEIVTKWGFGSGISLFIAAGVSSQIIINMINPLAPCIDNALKLCIPDETNKPAGLLPNALLGLLSGNLADASTSLIPIFSTLIVFLIVIYAQAIRVEIPLAFGYFRGFGRSWPLKFIYTSNIPVILTAALIANVQVVGALLASKGFPILGTFDANNSPTSGLVFFLSVPRELPIQTMMLTIGVFTVLGTLLSVYYLRKYLLETALLSAFAGVLVWYFGFQAMGFTAATALSVESLARLFVYTAFLTSGSVLFSVFWVNTANMNAESVAKQIQSIGMQIPGFRRDPRIIESVLDKYIPNLAVLGGLFIGILAAFADSVNALGTGTGILLTVMIIYTMYEQLGAQQMEDMHPAIRKMFGKE
ncbi:MAG: preprotein translocase subunit SecY [Candidatus Aenigmarchaeota archaeon]|nr:preprotein translocase subunit SecY [Candidatus Aenigmarchaeota archaeon]